MENKEANKEWLRSLLTGDWWREREKLEDLSDSKDDQEQWFETLLPSDAVGLPEGRPSGLTPGTVEFSVPLSKEKTADLHNWVNMNVVDRSNSVFLDTTCLETARILVEEGERATQYLLPLTLLDLSTFVSCSILYDQIYHLQNPLFNSQNIKTIFGEELFFELPVEDIKTDKHLKQYFSRETSVEEILESIYDSARQWGFLLRGRNPRSWHGSQFFGSHGWLGNKIANAQVQPLSEGWKAILGQDLSLEELLGDPNRELGSWPSPTEDLIWKLRRADQFYSVPLSFNFASESNYRAMFNHILAQSVLELPYAPSSARWPFRRFLYSVSKDWPEVILESDIAKAPSLDILQDYYQSSMFGEGVNLQLPPFLAVILNRVDRPSQIPEEIAYWREAIAPFRQYRREIDENLKSPRSNRSEISRLLKALKNEAEDPSRWRDIANVGVVLGIIAPVFFQNHPLAGVLLSLVLTAPSLFDPSTIESLQRRLFRRDLYFLARIGYEIDELTEANILLKIEGLWNLREDDAKELPSRLRELKRLQLT